MVRTRYIDPELENALSSIDPSIRREVGYSFDIAKRISEILALKHWTQADLARAAGKKKALVSRWLSGTHNFTIQTIAEIEAATGATIISIKKSRSSQTTQGYGSGTWKSNYLSGAKGPAYGSNKTEANKDQ